MEWITCEDTYEECWRRLLEYANTEIAYEAIESIHGPPSPKHKENYKKQADQIRASLLQAKEYFDAARNSSLFTKPNHLYYGAVGLCSACMLLRGDGNKALDNLRRSKSNLHHGLEFTFSSNVTRAKKGLNLLENSFVKILSHGHFPNWYSCLEKHQNVYGLTKRIQKTGINTRLEITGYYDLADFNHLVNQKYSLLDLVKRLPDLNFEVQRYGIKSNTAVGEQHFFIDSIKNTRYNEFVFHSSNNYSVLMRVVDKFRCSEGICFSMDIEVGSTCGIVRTRSDRDWAFQGPDSRDTMDHKTIFYDEEFLTNEIVDCILACFGLSMLSRYYPDIWVSFLESNCKGASLVKWLTSILTTKLPMLMLSQMAGYKFTISTQRPYWQ